VRGEGKAHFSKFVLIFLSTQRVFLSSFLACHELFLSFLAFFLPACSLRLRFITQIERYSTHIYVYEIYFFSPNKKKNEKNGKTREIGKKEKYILLFDSLWVCMVLLNERVSTTKGAKCAA
jgi:hypothetical protein